MSIYTIRQISVRYVELLNVKLHSVNVYSPYCQIIAYPIILEIVKLYHTSLHYKLSTLHNLSMSIHAAWKVFNDLCRFSNCKKYRPSMIFTYSISKLQHINLSIVKFDIVY